MFWRVSRGANIAAQAVEFPALLVGAPVQLSNLGHRHGWSDGRPGVLNLAGVIPLGAGAALLLWSMSSHYRAAPKGWEIRLAPDYLLESGPYRFSRNPMYVGEAIIWLGWAALFGSLPIIGGLAILTAIQTAAVRLEERALHNRWGGAYDSYRAQIPRWILCTTDLR
jgi:protein-S-isoprenylcysteine O-methyltransferase Ste14